jgi:protein arginine N-methyltransferase 1
VDPWDKNALGQNLSPARQLALNDVQKVRLATDQLLTRHELWTTLDYANVDNHNVRGNLEWTVERRGIGHGIVVWFDAELAEGVGFSNAPGTPETVYGSLFFPWAQPVPLAQGQTVCASLCANLVENDYVWRWSTRIETLDKSSASRIQFEQSQLDGAVLSASKLHRTAADYVPVLSEEGRLRRRTFELMDGKASLEEIAHRLEQEFPQRFQGWQQALSYAGAVSQEHTK